MPRYRVTYTTRVSYDVLADDEKMALETFLDRGIWSGEYEGFDFDVQEMEEDD